MMFWDSWCVSLVLQLLPTNVGPRQRLRDDSQDHHHLSLRPPFETFDSRIFATGLEKTEEHHFEFELSSRATYIAQANGIMALNTSGRLALASFFAVRSYWHCDAS
ncbi:hypothetical protein PM082_009258 [Marasmius tenuissimus]|nr:hypothetical protein PM082_009258 [Marasmius tenuissimus]